MREKILTAAARLFADNGYSAVSMRRIATAVGVTQANLYYYFRDKEELIRSVLEYAFTGKNQTFVAEAGDAALEERLEQAIACFLTLLFEDAVLAKLFFRELMTDDGDRLKFLTENIFQDSFDTLVKILGEYLDTADPLQAAIFLTSTLIGYRQFARIIPHLHGAKPEYVEPAAIARHFMDEIRKLSKENAVSG
ncbi:TetR/AcrR family transcriptional regulator [Solidesulfovibrio sp.]|uniref:TetR/AcrR family transcriptional regulator n=1 Tax=Solidesulfovibrio sp. TaxID=2910990 RepID=UPI0026275F3A|nr:TetR/AcrR family transcriptional regulator [Solidesulfovibrio sp.]